MESNLPRGYIPLTTSVEETKASRRILFHKLKPLLRRHQKSPRVLKKSGRILFHAKKGEIWRLQEVASISSGLLVDQEVLRPGERLLYFTLPRRPQHGGGCRPVAKAGAAEPFLGPVDWLASIERAAAAPDLPRGRVLLN